MTDSKINIGGARIDASEWFSQGTGVLGIRDSGKSYTATLLAERAFDAGVPFVAFDPVGVWRFLRVPGEGKGYPIVVAGGEAGDLPLTPATAPAIVEAAMQSGVSLVLDLFTMELSKADWRRIVKDCVHLLLHKNKQHGLRHIFLEEAAEFAPQRVGPEQGAVYSEIEKLARMGGNSRLGYTLINQRAEEVNKAVLELCDNLLLHRQKGKNSLVSLAKWLDAGSVRDGKAIVGSLATLPQGQCYAWLAGQDSAALWKVPAKNSLHPDRRVMRGDAEAAQIKPVDAGAFVAAMQAALPGLEQAAADSDPAKLRARIKALEATAHETPARLDITAIRKMEEQAGARGYAQGYRHAFAELAGRLMDSAKAWRAELDTLYTDDGPARERDRDASHQFVETTPSGPDANGYREFERQSAPSPHSDAAMIQKAKAAGKFLIEKPYPTAPEKPAAIVLGDVPGIKNPEMKVLEAMAALASMGFDTPTKAQVAAFSGYAVNGGAFGNILGRLRSAGLADYPTPGFIRMTPQGEKAAPAIDRSRPVLERLRGVLKGPHMKVLSALPKGGGHMRKDQLAAATGYTASGGAFGNITGRLRTLGLVNYPKPNIISAEPWVFQ